MTGRNYNDGTETKSTCVYFWIGALHTRVALSSVIFNVKYLLVRVTQPLKQMVCVVQRWSDNDKLPHIWLCQITISNHHRSELSIIFMMLYLYKLCIIRKKRSAIYKCTNWTNCRDLNCGSREILQLSGCCVCLYW